MRHDPPRTGNERPELCAACGGACCVTRPGVEAPERFLAEGDPEGALAAALSSGDWVLAEHVGVPWVDGIEPPEAERRLVLWYPRPATVGERSAWEPASGSRGAAATAEDAGSRCVFLGESGCRLAYGARPRMCQSLEPDAGGECEAAWGRREAALAWRPHQPLVAAARARRLTP